MTLFDFLLILSFWQWIGFLALIICGVVPVAWCLSNAVGRVFEFRLWTANHVHTHTHIHHNSEEKKS